jgi:hypothetical protein
MAIHRASSIYDLSARLNLVKPPLISATGAPSRSTGDLKARHQTVTAN